MYIESQGNEPTCLLATIAALTGASYADVKRFACKAAGVRAWRPGRRSHGDYWGAARKTADHFSGSTVLWDALDSRGRGRGVPGRATLTIPETGRGAITIRNKNGHGHISPWENGRIYNSDAPAAARIAGETLAEYLARYPGFHVTSLTTLPAARAREE